MTRILVVSATQAEAAYVPPGMDLLITGLGRVQAGVEVTRALMELPADQRSETVVVNIGTVGQLRSPSDEVRAANPVAGLYEIGRVLNIDVTADIIRQLGYDPMEWIEIDPSAPAVLATTDAFVNDPVRRDFIAQQADVVDMEGYGIAYACHSLEVRCRLIKHVSDQADEGAMDWPAAIDASAQVLGHWLATHAQGV